MRLGPSSSIMPRTTLNIDAPILKDLKRLQRRERKPLGRLVSELLALALRQPLAGGDQPSAFRWISRPMGTRVDLLDKEALRMLLNAGAVSPPQRVGRG